MLNTLIMLLVRAALWLRYRIRVKGLDNIVQKGRSSILFLPNHPALIDPVILVSRLYLPFKVRALADETQIDRPVIRSLARRINVLSIPDLTKAGAQSVNQVRDVMDRCAEALKHRENLVLYPAGRIYRQHLEEVGANSGVERILKALPNVRIVLVRTRGLWGSSASWAGGQAPNVKSFVLHALKSLILNGFLFTPRREVTIELVEPDDLPRTGERKILNHTLETFYNEADAPNTYVPYTFWESGGIQVRPEPEKNAQRDLTKSPSPIIIKHVQAFLRDATGVRELKDDMSLSRDLGMDSLSIVDLISWLEKEYGHSNIDPDALLTVSDVFWAAAGEAISMGQRGMSSVPTHWFRTPTSPDRPDTLKAMTVTEAFLYQAKRGPGRSIVADPVSGVKSYRDMILAIMLLRKAFLRLPGDVLGIMLPASVGVTIVYLAALFAGKIPVMVNWTLGRRNLLHALNALDVDHIITARALLSRIGTQGVELDDIEDRFVALEDLRTEFTFWDKLKALVNSYVTWQELMDITPPDTAAVLFTSGSESVPKAVPLTHKNLLTNVSDLYDCFSTHPSDGILGILPPFHSFGLTGSMLFPLTLGMRVVYYPNPTHGGTLAGMIEAYKLTLLLGTPTFLGGILRTARKEQLSSLRIVVSGAEKCPQRIYNQISEMCEHTHILEAYGVTECAPCISINHEEDPHLGSIGRVMDSLTHVIVDAETGERLGVNQKGILLVRGDSVFSGYRKHAGPSPFVEFEGQLWYRTGDLIKEDEQGILTFCGRLKRFIKLGGEMISLPAIESVLQQHFDGLCDEGPMLAVVATPVEENPDIILFSKCDIDRESANSALRKAGLSGLHNIRQAIRIDELPLLGTGKIDYKALTGSIDKST
jgi:acyl-CoA synthetase (AMP-forming)/AMP-acid ligase II/1-acyl-sn-glycerol-3-phosphate acyltransferase/acyl carrier protein